MADPTSLPPPIDPSQYPAWLDAQRKQQIAGMLMNSLQSANQTPTDWNSMKVVPKRGMLQNVSVLADALMARKGLNASNAAAANYYSGGTAAGGGGAAPSPDTATQAAGSQGPPSPNGAMPSVAPGNVPQQQSQNPMIPPGMTPQQAQTLNLMGGREELVKAAIARAAPLEIQRQLRAANIDPDSPQGQAIIARTLQKGAYIPPIEQHTGSIERDPITNQVIGQNPSLPTGGVNFYDAKGNLTGSGMSPGAAGAIATSEGAAAAGKTANTPAVIPTAGGGSTYGYPGDVLGKAPPALRGAAPVAAPNAAPASTAPRVVNGIGNTGAPAVAPKSADPWANVPKLAISKTPGAPDEFTKGVLQAAGTKHAELSTKYGQDADLADQKLQYNSESMKALPNAEVGPMSEWLTHNRASLLEMGVPKGLIPDSGSVTSTLELNKNLKNAALQGAKATFGARMTQNEVMLQHEELSPSTSMTRDAITSLIAQDNIKQNYAKQRADDYGKFVQQGGDPLRFESWYSKNFPLTKFAQAASATVPAGAGATHAPADLEAEMRRRGLLK